MKTETEGFRLISRFEMFTDEILQATHSFPRNAKYSVGAKLESVALNLCEDLYMATYCREVRLQTLYRLRASVHLVGFLLRIAHGRKLISHGHFAKLTKEQGEFSKMISSWIKRTNTFEKTPALGLEA